MGCGFKRRGGTGRVNEGQGLTNKGGAYRNGVWLGEEGRGLERGRGFKKRGGTGSVNEGQGLKNGGVAYINGVWLGEEGRGLKSEAANSQWFQFNLIFFCLFPFLNQLN